MLDRYFNLFVICKVQEVSFVQRFNVYRTYKFFYLWILRPYLKQKYAAQRQTMPKCTGFHSINKLLQLNIWKKWSPWTLHLVGSVWIPQNLHVNSIMWRILEVRREGCTKPENLSYPVKIKIVGKSFKLTQSSQTIHISVVSVSTCVIA